LSYIVSQTVERIADEVMSPEIVAAVATRAGKAMAYLTVGLFQ
jgi:hypothetical protein